MYIYRAFLLGGIGESPATSSKIAHSLPPGKILQVHSLPDQVFILPPPKISFPIPSPPSSLNNVLVITQRKLRF